MKQKHISIALFLFLLSCTACTVDSKNVVPYFDSFSNEDTESTKISDNVTSMVETDIDLIIPDNSNDVNYSETRLLAEDYIEIIRSDKEYLFKHGTKCKISLLDVYGDERLEMLYAVKGDNALLNGEYYYTVNELGTPKFMGFCYGFSDELYTDGKIFYTLSHGNIEPIDCFSMTKLSNSFENTGFPDMASYTHCEALQFINDTHMFFLRYDNEDWDSEAQTWHSPEKTAAFFYYEDSNSYEIYSVSKNVLEITSMVIGDITNADGNLIYSYLPGENYIVSRNEYNAINAKLFEMLETANVEQVISSDWINIEEIHKWLETIT